MSDRPKHDIAVEYLDVVSTKGTPDIIAMDCGMKARCTTPGRPWPFESAHDAALPSKKRWMPTAGSTPA